MRVLRHGDVVQDMTIRTGANGNVCEAGGIVFHAAVRDLGDPGGVIKLEIPLLVEGGIAHWSRRGRRLEARRHWKVNVEVLSASVFSLASGACATMLGEDCIPIHVVRKRIITQEILARMRAFVMAINMHLRAETVTCHVHACNGGPFTVMVNLKADGVTVLVIFLTSLIDALLGATLAEELLLGVIMEEDVNIALNLLGC